LGRALGEEIIAEAREIGYRTMRLDTVEPVMKDAVAMYRQFGFKEVPPYCANPIAGAMYMEKTL
jgi:ribosomal protein S18 acetylase RimI-like enzyme